MVHINEGDLNGDFIRINVCGMIYETLKSTLERFPSTLLGNEQRRQNYFVGAKNAYFFDRNRESFGAILYYYQSHGTLIRPPNIPMLLFTKEISFFDLGEEAFLSLQQKEGFVPEKVDLPKIYWQRKIWESFEFPHSSIVARLLAFWSILIIGISVGAFCLETIPTLHKAKYIGGKVTTDASTPKYEQPWFALELGCIAWFTVEYFLRFVSSPNKCNFAKSFLNIIDLLAILPYFITVSMWKSGDTTRLSVLRAVRLIRVFRIFKLSRYSLGLQILGQTLKASIRELAMLILFLLLGVVLFSSAMYYAEQGGNDMFTSIPDAFWYSLVTMTTVGYGDKWPKTFTGKLVGSMCAVCGVFTIALPVPVIVSNFEFYYKSDGLDAQQYVNAKQMVPSLQASPVPGDEFAGEHSNKRINGKTKMAITVL